MKLALRSREELKSGVQHHKIIKYLKAPPRPSKALGRPLPRGPSGIKDWLPQFPGLRARVSQRGGKLCGCTWEFDSPRLQDIMRPCSRAENGGMHLKPSVAFSFIQFPYKIRRQVVDLGLSYLDIPLALSQACSPDWPRYAMHRVRALGPLGPQADEENTCAILRRAGCTFQVAPLNLRSGGPGLY